MAKPPLSGYPHHHRRGIKGHVVIVPNLRLKANGPALKLLKRVKLVPRTSSLKAAPALKNYEPIAP